MFTPRIAKPKSQRPAVAARRPGEAAATRVHLLQRTIGREAAPSWDFSKIPVFSRGSEERLQLSPLLPAPRFPIQAKLKIGAVNDPLEHEADRVAEQVMRMPAPGVSAAAAPPQLSCKCAECEEEEKLQRKSAAPQTAGEAPASVHDVLRSPGQALDAATRAFFEPRFGQDFSGVRVHDGTRAAESAHDVNAHGYTVGHSVVFGAGQFAPGTHEGQRLLAHELTHVVQQAGRHGDQVIQRDTTKFTPKMSPKEFVDQYRPKTMEEMLAPPFEGLAYQLYLSFTLGLAYPYIRAVIEEIGADYEDNVAALFVDFLTEPQLQQFASGADGRATLDVLYEAIITGDVSRFERKQANRLILARAKQIEPEDYVAKAKRHSQRWETKIFPVRFMRVTPGYDYAPPAAKLLPNGNVLVRYPTHVLHRDTFKAELRTPIYHAFMGEGLELPADEIVGIKQYEQGGQVVYLPALALIDFSNQAIQSTGGKIIEVSMAAATLGFAGAPIAGAKTAGTRWGAGLALADRVATVIGVAHFFVEENRDWIVSTFGSAGRLLVRTSEIANSVAAIYGIGRLGSAGYMLVKDLRAASKACREQASKLKEIKDAERQALNKIDDETDALLRELEEAEAAKTGSAAGSGSGAETRASKDAHPDAPGPGSKELTPSAAESQGRGAQSAGTEATPRDLSDVPKVSPKAREVSVANSRRLEEPNPRQLRNEIDEVVDHPELLRNAGSPPRRQRKMGKHEWVETSEEVWCRYSKKACVRVPRAAKAAAAAKQAHKPAYMAGSARPRPGEALVGSSREQMRRAAIKIILADEKHPLRFLLTKRGRWKSQLSRSHAKLINRPDLVEMGHIGSDKLGLPERLMIQSAWENQLRNISIEHPTIGGAVLPHDVISIGGIAVHKPTAQFWEDVGFLKPGSVAGAPIIQ